jgi:hypothetical protein
MASARVKSVDHTFGGGFTDFFHMIHVHGDQENWEESKDDDATVWAGGRPTSSGR